MDLQEKFDNFSTGQKVLLYVVALVMLIISGILSIFCELNPNDIRYTLEAVVIILLLLDLVYFNIILFFSLGHIQFNKKPVNIIGKIFLIIIINFFYYNDMYINNNYNGRNYGYSSVKMPFSIYNTI